MSAKITKGVEAAEPRLKAEPTPKGKEFGRYLRNLRKKKGMNQAELAELAGITSGYYGFFEQGRQIPSLKIINRLSELLDSDYLEMAQRAGYSEGEALKKELPRALKTRGDDAENKPAIDEAAPVAVDYPGSSGNSQQPGTRSASNSETSSPTEELAVGVAQERLDWALQCIVQDPSYKLAEQFKQEALSNAVKVLVIQLYQAQTSRQLLTSEEASALNSVVHG